MDAASEVFGTAFVVRRSARPRYADVRDGVDAVDLSDAADADADADGVVADADRVVVEAAEESACASPYEQSATVRLGASQARRRESLTSEAERRRFDASRALVVHAAVSHLAAAVTPPAVVVEVDATCMTCGGPHGPLRLQPVNSVAAGIHTPAVSLSHAGEVSVVAVSDDARLGVDIEMLEGVGEERSDREADALVARLRHIAAVLGLPADAVSGPEDEERVLRRWVRVEAVLKADGRGLRVDPSLVRFTSDDTSDPAAEESSWTAVIAESDDASHTGRAPRFAGQDVHVMPGSVAAVAWLP